MCTKQQIGVITRRIAALAKEIFGEKLRSVILYGSYARGDFDEESDVDLMILVDLPREELWRYDDPITALTGELGLAYDAVIVATLKDTETFDAYLDAMPFYQTVKKEGIPIAV